MSARQDSYQERLLLGAAAVVVAAMMVSAQGDTAPGVAARLLNGTIDIHVHHLPDDRARSIDAIDVAKLAALRGMRAIVLKNHYESTAGLAWVVRKLVPGIEVFGGVDLNLTVGGINPDAVEHMTKVTGGFGRFVWMPTFDAENQVRLSKENRRSVSVSKDGELLPAVKEVIALVARHDLVLATGHSTPAEVLMLLREARRVGARRTVVTHATQTPVLMDVPQMQEAAKLGAFIEFVGGNPTSGAASARLDAMADAIRKVGPQFVIVSTDLGQAGNPLPPDGFGAFLAALRARGFSAAEVDRMAKQNPTTLLGLK